MIGASFVSFVSLILSFDGALRYPSDPAGYAVHYMPKMTSSAAIIMNDSSKVLKTIAKLHSDSLSSSECEYLGLILGLEELKSAVEKEGGHIQDSHCRIQGDAKTVIEQMQGRSRPRKLEPYFEQCQQLLDEIPMQFVFRHVPRSQNTLADSLASTVITNEQCRVLGNAIDTILSLSDSPDEKTVNDMLIHSFDKPSPIPLSTRVVMYQYLASLSLNPATLVFLGELYERDLKRMNSDYSHAIRLQIQGQHAVNPKREHFLLRKNRFLLENTSPLELYSSQLRVELQSLAETAFNSVVDINTLN